MEQQSTDWFVWRSQGIGSSDVAAILGLSPFHTPLQLWRIKTGLDPQVADSVATYHGRKYEPKARACFELTSFKDYIPKLFQSQQYPFMRVSLDGWYEEDREVLEIKCPGKETLALAERGEIPDYYRAQIQYQLFVADGKRAIYFAFNPETEKGFEIEVFPDEEFMKQMVAAVIDFWMRVQRKKPPPLSDRDWLEFPPTMESILAQWKDAHLQGDKDAASDLKSQIISKMTHGKMKGYGVKIYSSRTKSGGQSYRISADKGHEAEEETACL